MQKFTTCLMFVGEQAGKAEEAMNLYTSLFKNSSILNIDRHGAGGPDAAGTVRFGLFSLNGQNFIAMDSAADHKFNFTPSMSIFVTCESEQEIDNAYATLMQGGFAMMPLDNYGFSQKFAWVADKFGVSWQLNLPAVTA